MKVRIKKIQNIYERESERCVRKSATRLVEWIKLQSRLLHKYNSNANGKNLSMVVPPDQFRITSHLSRYTRSTSTRSSSLSHSAPFPISFVLVTPGEGGFLCENYPLYIYSVMRCTLSRVILCDKPYKMRACARPFH